MLFPYKGLLGALTFSYLISCYANVSDPLSIAKILSFFILSMGLNLLPMFFFYKRATFQFIDHLLGPYILVFPEPPRLSNTAYFLGPLCNFAASLYLFQTYPALAPYNLIPLFWAILRLCPIEPFEGWHILRGCLRSLFGFLEKKLSYFISALFTLTVGFIVLSTIPHLYWIGLIAIALSCYSFEQYRKNRVLGPGDEDPEILTLFRESVTLFRENRVKEADSKLWQIIQSPLKGSIIDQARIVLAKGLLEEAQPQKALEILTPCLSRSPKGVASLLHSIAYQCNQFDMVRHLASQVWNEEPKSSTAMINAIASAKLYEVHKKKKFLQETLGWLHAAKRMKYYPWDALESSDFHSMKEEIDFIAFKQKIFCKNK